MGFSSKQQKNTVHPPAKAEGGKVHAEKSSEKDKTTTQTLHGIGAVKLSPSAPSEPAAIIQPKLSVNAPGDAYEREADEMAERVMRMETKTSVQNQVYPNILQRKCSKCETEEENEAEPEDQITQIEPDTLQRKCDDCDEEEESEPETLMRQIEPDIIQRKCATCEKDEDEEELDPLMRKAYNKDGFEVSSSLVSQIQASKGGGSALPDKVRGFMENAFRTDFSHIRIHTDARAAEMSHSIHARAFTHGRDIYFNNGQFAPDSGDGKRLLAHELTHTLQQRKATTKPIQTKTISDTSTVAPESQTQSPPLPLRPASDLPIDPETQVKVEKPEKKVETQGIQDAQNASKQSKSLAGNKSLELQKTNEKNDAKLKDDKNEKSHENELKPLEKLEQVEKEQAENPVLDKANEQDGETAESDKEPSAVDAKLQQLVTTPLAFSEEEADKEQIEGIRQANQVVNNFFGSLLGQIQGLNGVSATIQPNIDATATDVKTKVTSLAESQKEALVTQVSTADTEAKKEAESAKAKVRSAHKTALAKIKDAATASKDSINTSYKTALDALEQKAKDQRTAIDKRYNDADIAYRKSGVTVGKEGVDIAEAMARVYLSFKINRRDSITDGYLTDRRCEARAKAAREISKAYQTELEKMGNEEADKALKGKDKDYAELDKTIEDAKISLLAEKTAADKSVDDAAAKSTEEANKLKKSLNKSIDSQSKNTLNTLDTQKTTHTETIEGLKTNQVRQIDKSATESKSTLLNNLSEGENQLIDGLLNVKTGLNGKEAPPLEEINEKTSEVGMQIAAGIAATMMSIAEAVVSVNEGIAAYEPVFTNNITTTIASVFEGIKTTGDGFKESMKVSDTSTHSAFRDLKKSHKANSDNIAKDADIGLGDIAKKIGEGFTALNTELDTNTSNSIKGFEEGLRGAFEGAEGMKATIKAEAKKAADAEQPAWKSIVKWILIIAIIIVVALVIGPAVIAGVGAFLGTGTLATAVVAGAIVGAATSATLQVVNNWADGKPLLEGVGRAALVGAISGAIGGAAGFGLQKAAVEGAKQFVFDQAIGAVVDAGMTIVETGKLPSASEFFTNLGTGLALSLITLGATKTSRGKKWSQKSESYGAKVGEGLKAKIKPPKVDTPAPKVDANAATPTSPAPKTSVKPDTPAASGPGTGKGKPSTEAAAPISSKSKPNVEPTTTKQGATEQKVPPQSSDAPVKPKPDTPETSTKSAPKQGESPKAKPADTDTPGSGKPKSAGESGKPGKAKPGDTETSGKSRQKPASDTETPAGKPKAGDTETSGKPKQKPASDTETPGGKPKAGEADTPSNAKNDKKGAKSKGEPEPPQKSSHEGHPVDSEGVVARQKTADGHEVKVLPDGRVVTCSECGTMRMKYADELAKTDKLKSKLDEIEAIKNPKVKAQEAAKLRKRLERARQNSVAAADPPGGKALAQKAGLPDAPDGHHWSRRPDGSVSLKKNPGFKGKPLEYNPDAPKVKGTPQGFAPKAKLPKPKSTKKHPTKKQRDTQAKFKRELAKFKPGKASKKQKGNLGEIASHDDKVNNPKLKRKGYDLKKLGKDSPSDLNAKIEKGIDGIYENQSPPPKFIVDEAKYGTSKLNPNTKDGPQMGDRWTRNRLLKAVGGDKVKADEIRNAMRNGDVERVMTKVAPNGKVTTYKLDGKGKVIGPWP